MRTVYNRVSQGLLIGPAIPDKKCVTVAGIMYARYRKSSRTPFPSATTSLSICSLPSMRLDDDSYAVGLLFRLSRYHLLIASNSICTMTLFTDSGI